jgi:hypothetical protein
MNDEPEEKKLLEMGRDLSKHLLRQTAQQDQEALLQARRRALLAIKTHERSTARSGGWLPAAVVTGIAALSIVMISQRWDKHPLQEAQQEHSTYLAKNVMDADAPWNEDLDMLQNMDFSLWLDMAGSEDAG